MRKMWNSHENDMVVMVTIFEGEWQLWFSNKLQKWKIQKISHKIGLRNWVCGSGARNSKTKPLFGLFPLSYKVIHDTVNCVCRIKADIQRVPELMSHDFKIFSWRVHKSQSNFDLIMLITNIFGVICEILVAVQWSMDVWHTLMWTNLKIPFTLALLVKQLSFGHYFFSLKCKK